MPDITAALIRNILGSLNCIDFGDVDQGVMSFPQWSRFSAAPARIFPELSDDQQDAIAALINRKLEKGPAHV